MILHESEIEKYANTDITATETCKVVMAGKTFTMSPRTPQGFRRFVYTDDHGIPVLVIYYYHLILQGWSDYIATDLQRYIPGNLPRDSKCDALVAYATILANVTIVPKWCEQSTTNVPKVVAPIKHQLIYGKLSGIAKGVYQQCLDQVSSELRDSSKWILNTRQDIDVMMYSFSLMDLESVTAKEAAMIVKAITLFFADSVDRITTTRTSGNWKLMFIIDN